MRAKLFVLREGLASFHKVANNLFYLESWRVKSMLKGYSCLFQWL